MIEKFSPLLVEALCTWSVLRSFGVPAENLFFSVDANLDVYIECYLGQKTFRIRVGRDYSFQNGEEIRQGWLELAGAWTSGSIPNEEYAPYIYRSIAHSRAEALRAKIQPYLNQQGSEKAWN